MDSAGKAVAMRCLYPKDLEEAYAIEIAGYPADEAASYEQLVYRQREAGELFFGYFEGTTLIGYVCGTRSSRYSHDSMKHHDANGGVVCIHSLCVRADRHRQGIGLHLLKAYIMHVRRMAFDRGINKLALICKSPLIPLYTKAGFTFIGFSEIVHGQNRWYEMELIFKRSAYDDYVPQAASPNKSVHFCDDNSTVQSDPLEEYWE